MKINKNVELAIKMIRLMSESDNNIWRIQDLASAMDESRNFLDQVVRKLRIADIVITVRGPNGGCFLRNKTVSLYDLEVCFTPLKKYENVSIDAIYNLALEKYKSILV